MRKIKADFMKYVSLNVVGMIGLSCYILADTFFVAQALGTAGLASLNLSISIFSIIQGFGLMIGIGGATDFSISKQQSPDYNRSVSFAHSLLIGALVSLLFIAIAMFLTTPLAVKLGADEVTLPLTKTYLKTILYFSPFFILNHIVIAFVRNDKNPRLSMIAMLASSFSNIFLDYIFMFPLSMGIFGAAFATGLSPIISLCILSAHFKGNKQGFRIGRCKIEFSKALRILSLGFSSFIGELASAISLITFNIIIMKIAGNTGVAAYGIVANIALIATAILVGIAQGIQPLASKYYGKGEHKTVGLVLRYAIITALAASALMYVLLYAFSAPIVSIFNSEGNQQLAVLATNGIKIYFVGYLFAAVNIVSAAFLSAISSAKQAMLIAVLRSCLLLVPAVYILSILFQINGIWISFVVTELLVCIIAVFSVYRLKAGALEIST